MINDFLLADLFKPHIGNDCTSPEHIKHMCDVFDTVEYFDTCVPFITLLYHEDISKDILKRLLSLDTPEDMRNFLGEAIEFLIKIGAYVPAITILVTHFVGYEMHTDVIKDILSSVLELVFRKNKDMIKEIQKISDPNDVSLYMEYLENRNGNKAIDFNAIVILSHLPSSLFPKVEEKTKEKLKEEVRIFWYRCTPAILSSVAHNNNVLISKTSKMEVDLKEIKNQISFQEKVIENKELTIKQLNRDISALKEQLMIYKPTDTEKIENPPCRILPKVRDNVEEESVEVITPGPIKEEAPFKALINGSPWESWRHVRKVGILTSINSKKINKISKAYNHLKITLYDAFEKTNVIKQMLNEDCLIVMTEAIPHNVTDTISSASDLPVIYINKGAGQKLKAAFEYINTLSY